ncbi:gamma-glutamyl-gamma-aminobutyrate hydrolase family protein [Candidatus Saccharibacteria bacterium]|nr:gamma-glutamyl-gamma-aminobutyrate hydrolase family protein [Candidatus Saccharibacteria bacterium]
MKRIAIIARSEFPDGIGEDFAQIFQKLGAEPVKIDGKTDLTNTCEKCDALLVPGNPNNIPPRYYGKGPLPNLDYPVDDFALDKRVINKFYKAEKPILGICGGAQSVNVYFGGTMNQKVENHDLPPERRHDINIKPGSILDKIYKTPILPVNSLHHQAIKNPPKDFEVISMSPDRVIEAIAKDDILAVQWHPEKMGDQEFFKYWLNSF